MEIIWTYNWLETLGFLFLIFYGGMVTFRGLTLLWLMGKFKGWF